MSTEFKQLCSEITSSIEEIKKLKVSDEIKLSVLRGMLLRQGGFEPQSLDREEERSRQ